MTARESKPFGFFDGIILSFVYFVMPATLGALCIAKYFQGEMDKAFVLALFPAIMVWSALRSYPDLYLAWQEKCSLACGFSACPSAQ